MKNTLETLGQNSKNAAHFIASASTVQKNQTLRAIAEGLKKHQDTILAANRQDIEQAEKNGLNAAMIDRLSLVGRLDGIIQDVLLIADSPDPIGHVFDAKTLPNGLKIHKERTPLGVLGVIYESRPNVTIDVSCLAIKTGNCAILRGGSETLHTNKALVTIIQRALSAASLPSDAIQLITNVDRALVKELLHLYEYVDLIIPRGGAALHKFCRENSLIPVITGGIGICHLFVDETAEIVPSLEVIKNAKTQRPTVCNALDTLLVHQKIAKNFLPQLANYLKESKVTLKLDEFAWSMLASQHNPLLEKSHEGDWDTEWLSLILGVRIVANLDEAIEHIHQHSSQHSDGILTGSQENASQFIKAIDSAAVYVNASTRFTDGGQFGLGAEVAISTQKVHARGPMGLPELTSYKWVVQGNYHTRK